MLVLSRKKNQSIVINGNIVITVVNVKGGKVHLGVEAPREVSVHREEVFDSIASDQRSRSHPPDQRPEAQALRAACCGLSR